MATIIEDPLTAEIPVTIADIVAQLGDVPLERIRVQPPLGTATEADIERVSDRLCELVDGTLVEKPMGAYESFLAMQLGYLLMKFLETNPMGFVYGESASTRMKNKNVRMPDISFYRRDRFLDGKMLKLAVNAVAPDLAIEILSPSNTKKEMAKKLDEYFATGVKLVWYIDPPTRTAKIYTAIDQVTEITADGFFTGGEILPGLQIRLGEIFERADG